MTTPTCIICLEDVPDFYVRCDSCRGGNFCPPCLVAFVASSEALLPSCPHCRRDTTRVIGMERRRGAVPYRGISIHGHVASSYVMEVLRAQPRFEECHFEGVDLRTAQYVISRRRQAPAPVEEPVDQGLDGRERDRQAVAEALDRGPRARAVPYARPPVMRARRTRRDGINQARQILERARGAGLGTHWAITSFVLEMTAQDSAEERIYQGHVLRELLDAHVWDREDRE